MFKIRTIPSLVVLALILMATFQFASAKTEDNPSHSYDPANMIRNQAASTSPLNAPLIPNHLTQEECVDAPFGAVASVYACPNPSQIPLPVRWDLGRKASKTLNTSAPTNPSTELKCVNPPFGGVASVYACPNPSQIPLPEWLIMGGKAPNQ